MVDPGWFFAPVDRTEEQIWQYDDMIRHERDLEHRDAMRRAAQLIDSACLSAADGPDGPGIARRALLRAAGLDPQASDAQWPREVSDAAAAVTYALRLDEQRRLPRLESFDLWDGDTGRTAAEVLAAFRLAARWARDEAGESEDDGDRTAENPAR